MDNNSTDLENSLRLLETDETDAEIVLYNRGISDAEADLIAKAIEANKTLISINLGNNYINALGAAMIATALKKNMHLKLLQLNYNCIGDAGAEAIAEALKTNKALTVLELWETNISDKGAQKLADALKKNKTLISIDLGANLITDQGVKDLANALKSNKTLAEIALRYNKIRRDGVNAIAEVLKTNYTLISINLFDNIIRTADAIPVFEALKTNYTLTLIKLDRSLISDELNDQINTLIKRNIDAQPCRKKFYEPALKMIGQKTDPQAVLLALNEALFFAEQINDEAVIKEFKQHIPLYETLASLQELGIHGMHQWKTIIDGALQSDVNHLEDTHLQAAIQEARRAPELSVKTTSLVMYNALCLLNTPRPLESLVDLAKDLKAVWEINQNKPRS